MNDEKYWINRANYLIYHHMSDAEQTADEIATLYRKASKWLIYEARKIFDRYQNTHSLTEAEARRLISLLQDPSSIDDLKRLLEQEGRNKDILARLDAPAYQYRIDHLKQIQNQLDNVMTNIYQQEKVLAGDFFVDLAQDAYYRQLYEIQHNTSYAFSFAHIDRKQIDKVISMPWSGKHYSERLWKNQKTLTKALKEELLIDLVTGRPENEAVKILVNKFNQGIYETRRLVRTEAAFIAGELNALAYEECGLKHYQILATLDLRTSKICRPLDGRKYLLKDRQIGKNYPPFHPWCRCTTIVYISEDELKNLKRRALNPKTGRFELVPASMTYDEWYQKYVKNDPKALAQEKAIKNVSSDRKQYEKYQEALGDDVPKSFVKFQELKYNEPEKWKELKSLKQYLANNPGHTRADYELQKAIKETGMRGEINVKPKIPDVDKLSFDEKHVNQERQHNVTEAEAKSYIQNAIFSTTKWKGKFTNYYSDKGAAFVDNETQSIRTAFKTEQYDKSAKTVMEVIKRGQS